MSSEALVNQSARAAQTEEIDVAAHLAKRPAHVDIRQQVEGVGVGGSGEEGGGEGETRTDSQV